MYKIITISREYGAGGHSIGRRVAQELGIEFYDKDIVRGTAKATGYDESLIKKEEEDRSKTESIWKNFSSFASPTFHDSQDAIHEIQKKVILELAAKGPCVILGRCADVIMKEAGVDSLDVFIHADEAHRVMRLSEILESKDTTKIQKEIAKKDASRHNYYHHYTGKKWGDSHNYAMTLDSGVLGYDLCVEMIIAAAKAGE